MIINNLYLIKHKKNFKKIQIKNNLNNYFLTIFLKVFEKTIITLILYNFLFFCNKKGLFLIVTFNITTLNSSFFIN